MTDFPTQKITIYHKNEKGKYERYIKEASFRNTATLSREKYGFSSGVGDDGYYFNVKNEEVLGFFNLQLVPDKEYIKETTRSYLVGLE